mgnify:CR=1 FL=1
MLYFNLPSRKLQYSKVERLNISEDEGDLFLHDEIDLDELTTDEDIVVVRETMDGQAYFLTSETDQKAKAVLKIIEDFFDVKIVNEKDDPSEFERIHAQDYSDDFHKITMTCDDSSEVVYLNKAEATAYVTFITEMDVASVLFREAS